MTPGVEIHANVLHTLLTGSFLKPVPAGVRVGSLAPTAGATVAVVVALAGAQMSLWALLVLGLALIGTHIAFRFGWLLSSMELTLAFVWASIGGIVYRSLTAEKKSSFFRNAVALFVGKQVAHSLDQNQKIGLSRASARWSRSCLSRAGVLRGAYRCLRVLVCP